MAKPLKTLAKESVRPSVEQGGGEVVDLETFTSLKRESGFQWKPTIWNYSEGRRTEIKRVGVYIELNRGVEFKPMAFCASFKGKGWENGLPADELLEALRERAADRTKPEIVRYEDRPRPRAQMLLESEVKDLRSEIEASESLFERMAELNPEILELRKKVLAGA